MRPLLSRTTDGRLEIAAAQQVVQKKKKKGGKLGDTIKSDAPWTSPAPLCLCGEFASGMHVRNSGVLERQLSGITPGAWPIPTILKGKRQDALPVWRTGGSLLPRSPLCVFTFWIVAECSHRGFASARLLSFSVSPLHHKGAGDVWNTVRVCLWDSFHFNWWEFSCFSSSCKRSPFLLPMFPLLYRCFAEQLDWADKAVSCAWFACFTS